jgi:acyl carrier protein
LLEVVCEKTGYPREMLDLDMDLEADLGVDSIKRVEIIAGVEERLPNWAGVNPEHMGGIRTLREIVSFVDAEAGSSETHSSAGIEATVQTRAEPEPATAAPDSDAFSQALLAVVSELTGYPADMLDLGMDMEADLGIDSIKRVEILAAVEARMPDLPSCAARSDGFAPRTLQQIVEYCVPGGDGVERCSRQPRTPRRKLQATASNYERRHAAIRRTRR